MSPVDWCPNDGTLAREQVEGADRRCWRCGALVEKRDLEQWFLRTTDVRRRAARLRRHRLARADHASMQTNWIGRSEGAEIDFAIAPDDHQPGGDELRVFTTRPDTLFGATFMVLAPEHPLVDDADRTRTARAEVEAYVDAGPPADRDRAPVDRSREDRRRRSGADAINPVNGERIPICIADYVLAGYGTGAIMAVPAHDERDFEFAQQFGLPIRRVVAAPGADADDADGRGLRRARRRTSSWSTAARSTGMPRRRGRRGDRRAGWPRAAGPSPRSPTACATG